MSELEAEADGIEARSGQRSIQSIEVGFRLIRVLETAASKLALKTLAARAGMSPAKAHLYLVSFTRLGLVVQEPGTSRYGLGPYALQLGQAALRQLDLVDAARPPLERLHNRFELPAYLAIWGNAGPFTILKVDADLTTPVAIKVGFVFPLLSTATGRVFLASLPTSATEALVAREAVSEPDLAARRAAIVDEVRRDGVAISEGRLFRGFSAISAPVFDHTGAIAGAVTILGVGALMDRDPAGDMPQAVRRAAVEIGEALGFTADKPGARA